MLKRVPPEIVLWNCGTFGNSFVIENNFYKIFEGELLVLFRFIFLNQIFS